MPQSSIDDDEKKSSASGADAGVPAPTDAVPAPEENFSAKENSVAAAIAGVPEEALFAKRANGLTLAEAARVAFSAGDDVPALALVWENPAADTVNVRERKFAAAENLGAAFPRTGGALSRAAGSIASSKWSDAWQKAAEKASEDFAAAAENLGEKAADFTAATGLLPRAGTVASLKKLLRLVGALIAVRGEPAELALGADAEKNLETLRAAATLAESCARHKALLSLPYPDDACGDPRLDAWLDLWNEAEISRAFPRWRKRRKVVRALRELAGDAKKNPIDPRVDLGNLIAIRESRREFAEKFAETEKAFPSLLSGTEARGALPRIEVLEKARAAVAEALAELSDVPEKRDAWEAAFARWLGGNDAAFASGGNVEKALNEASSALALFDESRAALFDATGVSFSATQRSAQDAAAFAKEMLADRALWRSVCDWNRAALAAERRGMAALAEAVRAGTVPAERSREIFEISYCRIFFERLKPDA